MSWKPTSAHLESLSATIANKMGLRFGPDRWLDMARGVDLAGKTLGFADLGQWIHQLTTQPLNQRQIEVLAGQLTIGETYFLREKAAFDVFKNTILPGFAHRQGYKSKQLRIWSAACCTGEEAYSIAIVLLENLPDWRDWDISILATDINPVFLDKARRGVFNSWSFRDTPAHIVQKYFHKTDQNGLEIIPDIKRMVHFSYHNLAESNEGPAWGEQEPFDVVFCRNVLMYFDAAHQIKVVQQLFQCLNPGGWFIPGLTEISMTFSPPFEFVRFPEAMFCRKQAKEVRDSALMQSSTHITPEVPFACAPMAIQESEPAAETTISRLPQPEVELSQAGPTGDFQKRLKEARSAFEKNLYPDVIQLITESLQEGALDAGAQTLLARAYANCGRLEEALTAINKAVQRDKLSVEARYIMGLVLLELGDIQQAQEALNSALYLEPRHILSHVNQGRIAMRLGKPVLARKHLQNAIDLLQALPADCLVPESDGLTAAQFAAVLKTNVSQP